MKEQDILEALRKATIEFDEEAVKRLTREVVEEGFDPIKALEEGLSRPMLEIGKRFEEGEVFLSDLMLAAQACIVGINALRPAILESKPENAKPVGKVVIGTVSGDIHDIGKSMVCVLLLASGFEVHDIGKDQPVEKFVEEASKIRPDILASSALLTTTRPQQKSIEDALRDTGIRDKLKTIIGGGAADEEWREEIGADAYGIDAVEAVKLAKQLTPRGEVF
jgi:trimethylamine corrinoid protein